MKLWLLCLVGLTLLVSGATAALPALWLTRAPAARPAPKGVAAGSTLWLVRGGRRHWFVNGEPITAAALAQLLKSEGPTADVRLLPSSALAIGEVSEALGWLRRQGAAAVVLELPDGR